jgi:hypothetical protein
MYTMQEKIFIFEEYFRSHLFAINNHIWNFDVGRLRPLIECIFLNILR